VDIGNYNCTIGDISNSNCRYRQLVLNDDSACHRFQISDYAVKHHLVRATPMTFNFSSHFLPSTSRLSWLISQPLSTCANLDVSYNLLLNNLKLILCSLVFLNSSQKSLIMPSKVSIQTLLVSCCYFRLVSHILRDHCRYNRVAIWKRIT